MNNLIVLNSILGRKDQLVVFPASLKASEAVVVLNGLIVEAQRETYDTFPAEKTVGEFEQALFALLSKKMAGSGFHLLEVHKLKRTTQWNRIPIEGD